MKAIVYEEYGLPNVLHVKEVTKPEPKENEILIRVKATSINYGDILARNFKNAPKSKFNMPLPLYYLTRIFFGLSKPKINILGSEFAGKIESVGKNVKSFKPGDEVFGYLGQNMGAYAEYLCMPATGCVTTKPNNMSFEEAAVVPMGSIMALGLLKKTGIDKKRERKLKVLVNGASGSIGSFALQIVKNYGAEVTGVCGSPRTEFVKSLGADKVIDYTKEDFTTNGEQYDLIFDVLGKCLFSKCKNSLTEKGILLHVSFKMKHLLQMIPVKFFSGKKVICSFSSDKAEALAEIRNLTEAGRIKTIIDKTFTKEKAADAHSYVENGHKQGYVVITM